MTVSSNATNGGSCSGGIWSPTQDGANLNVGDIAGCAVSGSVTIGNGGTVDVQDWPSGLGDSVSVTLDGDSTIEAALTNSAGIDGLTVEGTTSIAAAAAAAGGIYTPGSQLYTSAVELGGDTVFSAGSGDITFDETIDGAHALAVSTNGTARFDGAVGSSTALTSIEVPEGNGGAELSGNVTTTGAQDFYGNLALKHDITLNAGGTVLLTGIVSGAFQMTMSGGGTMELSEPYQSGDSYAGTVVTGGSTVEFVPGALGSGPITLSGGTLTWLSPSDISSQLHIGTGGGILDTNGNDVTFADGFGGTGPLTKTGAGTLTLNAASGSYGSQIIVNQGTVLVPANARVATPVQIDAGGALTCDGGALSGGVTNDGGSATGAPDAPTNVVASPGFENATLSFAAGAANCYPLSYTVSGGGLSWSPSSSPATLSGLTGGRTYTFTLTATNPIGSAAASSNTITVSSTTITAGPYAPSVSISSPANGATYTYGQQVRAGYRCQEGTGGLGIRSCVGTNSPGSVLGTTAPGHHTFTVTATSLDGLTASTTVTYLVLFPPNSFKVKSLTASRDGTITVSLSSLPEPGTVKVTVRGTKMASFSVRKRVGTKSTLTFKVPASKRLRALLKRGSVSVRLAIAYTPTNGIPRELARSIRVR